MHRVVALATLTVSGCALMAAKAPDPDRAPWEVPVCNDGKGGVAGDAIVATLLGVGAAVSAPDSAGAAVGLGLTGGLFAASAAAGNHAANQCRAAVVEYQAYIDRVAPRGETATRRAERAVHAPGPGPAERAARAASRSTSRAAAAAAPPAPAPPPPAPAPAAGARADDTGPGDATAIDLDARTPAAAPAPDHAPAPAPDHAPPPGQLRPPPAHPQPPPAASDPWSAFWKSVP